MMIGASPGIVVVPQSPRIDLEYDLVWTRARPVLERLVELLPKRG